MELSDWLHQYSHTVCGKFFNRPNSFWESRQLPQPIAGDLCIQSNTKAAFLGANSRVTGLFLLALHGHPMPGTHFMQTHPKPWLTLSFFFLYKILHPTQNVSGGILTLKVVPTETGGLTGDSGWVNSYLVFAHWRCPLSQASASPLHSGDGGQKRPYSSRVCGFRVGSKVTATGMQLVGKSSRSTQPNTNPRSHVHTDTRSSGRHISKTRTALILIRHTIWLNTYKILLNMQVL